MKKYLSETTGVTLMEMLIVVAIIGILAGISIPNMMGIIRNNRVRAVALDILAVIRQERSRAISLGRQVQFTLDETGKTYSVIKLSYTLYNPLASDPSAMADGDILMKEPAQTLISNKEFDSKNWINEVIVSPSSFKLVFMPSGMVEIEDVAIASVQIKGEHIGYEIKVYKAGQVDLYRI